MTKLIESFYPSWGNMFIVLEPVVHLWISELTTPGHHEFIRFHPGGHYWDYYFCALPSSQVNVTPLRWRHNGHDCVWNHQPPDFLLNRLLRCRSKKTSKLRVTGLCAGNSPGPVNSPHKWLVMLKIMTSSCLSRWWHHHAVQDRALFIFLKSHDTSNVNSIRHIYASVNQPAMVQIMACHLAGAKPLYEPMLEYC